ncbi:hypothetical protein HYU19_00670 [Candidatus Woesearchaeota archaeon]|nr:hypothetical protein [Candidatus Woesearchaeota archaeon]
MADQRSTTAKEVYSFCMKKPMRNYLLFFLAALLAILLAVSFRSMFVILLLLAINAVLSLIIRPFKTVLSGIEIVTFSTVLCSVAYGPKTGMLVGLVSIIVSLLCLGRFTNYAVLMVPVVMLLGYLAFYLSAFGIAAAGIIMTAAYNLVIFCIIIFLGGNTVKGFSYIGVNIVLNIFLFSVLAPIALKMMVSP